MENALVFFNMIDQKKPCTRKSWIPYVSVSVSLRHVATPHRLSSQCWQWLVERRNLGHIVDATSVALCCLDGDSSRMRFVCGRSRAGRGPAVPPERVPDRNTNAVRSTRLSYSSRFRHLKECPWQTIPTVRRLEIKPIDSFSSDPDVFCVKTSPMVTNRRPSLAHGTSYHCGESSGMLSCLIADFKVIF